jgi:hypothetical protein
VRNRVLEHPYMVDAIDLTISILLACAGTFLILVLCL